MLLELVYQEVVPSTESVICIDSSCFKQEDSRYHVTYDRERAAQTRKDAASSVLRSSQRKHLVDWGYPRIANRNKEHASKTRSTLTPGLTSFFKGNRSALSQLDQRSAEATLFRSGTKQVEDAVLSLTARRKELEQDIKSLEVRNSLSVLPLMMTFSWPLIFCI